jgi:hypothetical protein
MYKLCTPNGLHHVKCIFIWCHSFLHRLSLSLSLYIYIHIYIYTHRNQKVSYLEWVIHRCRFPCSCMLQECYCWLLVKICLFPVCFTIFSCWDNAPWNLPNSWTNVEQ